MTDLARTDDQTMYLFRRWYYGNWKRARHLYRDGRRRCGGSCTDGVIADRDGSRVIRRQGWNSDGLYRTGRGRPQPAIRCSDHGSVGAGYEHADPPDYDLAHQSVTVPFDVAEHDPVRDDCDRC